LFFSFFIKVENYIFFVCFFVGGGG